MTETQSREPLTKVLLRKWRLTLILALLGALLGGIFAAVQPSTAKSTAALYISAGKAEQGSDPSQLTSTVGARMYSYYNLTKSGTVLQPVIDKLKLDTTVVKLSDSVQANVPANSMIIEVTASAATPEQSTVLADAIRDSLGNAIKALTPDQDGGLPSVQIFNYQNASDATVVEKASIPLYAIVGLALGLLAAAGLARSTVTIPLKRHSTAARRRDDDE